MTLCFSALQALVAAKAGATMLSFFVGRLDDIGHLGIEEVSKAREIFDNYGFETEILVASVRHSQHILDAARVGADSVTAPYKVLNSLLEHPLTKTGLAKFLEDAKKNS